MRGGLQRRRVRAEGQAGLSPLLVMVAGVAAALGFGLGVAAEYLEARKAWREHGHVLRLLSSMLASPIERDFAALKIREMADHLAGERR